MSPVSDGTAFRVRLFGVPAFDWNGAPISLSARPACSVLFAMLLLAEPDRRVSRRALAARLWPEDDESAAAANLRRHLSYLVTTLPGADACVGRDREALWCKASGAPWCDVVEFERGALDLYDADFMEGSSHDWVLEQRERLRAVALEGLLVRAEARYEDDDHEGAMACVRHALRIDPSSESAAHLEITMLGERGNLAALNIAFADLTRRLREIDAKPDAATVALVERFHALAREAGARIPRPLTSFVEPQRAGDLAKLVLGHRLVTVVGPGGVGKTRVALEVAHRLAATFADGAYFVDLSAVSEGDALSDALARGLGTPTDLASKGFTGIYTFLRNRRALVVLDNCEQITDSTSWFVSDLLETAPHVRVIATTRQAFGLRAERCYGLQPLTVEAAAQLFLDRARDAAWRGEELPGNAARIAAVCERLDRLPLALELAASMLGALPLADVERTLDEGLDRLRSRDPTSPVRHRSLTDVIAWSVSLLDDRERDAFVKLAVFAGPFSATDAEAVCAVDLSTLALLVTKSVLAREDAVESRFVYLNSIHHYARRVFESDPRSNELRNAHAARYGDLAMHSEEPSFWRAEREWLDGIGRSYPNIAQALNWSIFEGGDVRNGFRLAKGLCAYFARRGFIADGVFWLRGAIARTEAGSTDRATLSYRLAALETRRGHFDVAYDDAHAARIALARAEPGIEFGRALDAEANILLFLGRTAEAHVLLTEALPIARRFGDLRTEGWILSHIGYAIASTEPAESQEFYLQALRRFRECGSKSDEARMLGSIAAWDYMAERYDLAMEHLERAFEYHREVGDASSAASVTNDLGDVALMQGLTAAATAYYAEAFAFSEMRDSVLSYPTLLTGIAGIAMERRRPRDAARLIGAARWDEDGAQTPARLRVFEHVRARIDAAIGNEAYVAAVEFGREMPWEDVRRLVHSTLESSAATS